MSENITVTFRVPRGAGLGRYLCAAGAPFGPRVELRRGYSWVWTIVHPSPSAFSGHFSLVQAHTWSPCSGTTGGVSFSDIPGSHFRSAVRFCVQRESRGQMWKLDRWPALLTNQEMFSYPHLRGCSNLTAEPHILWYAVALWSHIPVVETVYAFCQRHLLYFTYRWASI